MAWQFDRPEHGRGFVLAFRRAASPYTTATFALHGLEGDARYEVTNGDDGATRELGGRELATNGLPVTLNAPNSSALLTYRRVNK